MINTSRKFKYSQSDFQTTNNPQFDTYSQEYQADHLTHREYVEESLKIAGMPVNIFPMIGIHQQGLIIDLCQDGYPVDSGTAEGYNAIDAFIEDTAGWMSIQKGKELSTAFLGYYFGERMSAAVPTQTQYVLRVDKTYRIQSMVLQQGPSQINRVKSIYVECSRNGIDWHTVEEIDLDYTTADPIKYPINSSGTFSYWRIKPAKYDSTTVGWNIKFLGFFEQNITNIYNIEDDILMENRSREYSPVPIYSKCFKNPIDVPFHMSHFGIDLSNQYDLKFAATDLIQKLGRLLLPGDIIDFIPEQQIGINLAVTRKMLEVYNVYWDNSSYSANHTPTVIYALCTPLIASRKTKDITGLQLDYTNEEKSLVEKAQGIDISKLGLNNDAAIHSGATDNAPVTGVNAGGFNITNKSEVWSQDAQPVNQQPYTKGPELPKEPKPNQYHIMTYDPKLKLPEKLWKFDGAAWRLQQVNIQTFESSYQQIAKDLLNAPHTTNKTLLPLDSKNNKS